MLSNVPDRFGFAMQWHGIDIKQALDRDLISSFADFASVFLQLHWTLSTVADLLNVCNTDIHTANCVVELAPFNGLFEYYFSLKLKGQEHVVRLRSRLRLTIVDWGLAYTSNFTAGLHPSIKNIMAPTQDQQSRFERSNSRSELKSSASSSQKSSVTSDALPRTNAFPRIADTWTDITALAATLRLKESAIVDGRVGNIYSLNVNTWINATTALSFDSNGESIVILSTFDENIRSDRFSRAAIGFQSFEPREYVGWVSKQSATLSGTSSNPSTNNDMGMVTSTSPYFLRKRSRRETLPSPASSSASQSEPTTKQKRGRPLKNGTTPQSSGERYRSYFKKKKEAESACAEMHHVYLDYVPTYINIILDSELIIVKPSPIGGLGVFAAAKIAAKTDITDYYGVSSEVSNVVPERGNWRHTHMVTFNKGSNALTTDGIRYPMVGRGVASLINSVHGTDKKANVVLSRTDSVPTKITAVAINDIEKDEELLADYVPL
ncbi:hypothetical protein EON65_33940 [archaeon]|nr:MAG: hypothetical protein EON65_33940 [archaeon]